MILEPSTLSIMAFYSVLTFFVSPGIADLLGYCIDAYLPAMIIGFIVSILLWLFYGIEYAN
jgi:hypothetical protein